MAMAFTVVKAWLSELSQTAITHEGLAALVEGLNHTPRVALSRDDVSYYIEGDLLGITVAHKKIVEHMNISAGIACDTTNGTSSTSNVRPPDQCTVETQTDPLDDSLDVKKESHSSFFDDDIFDAEIDDDDDDDVDTTIDSSYNASFLDEEMVPEKYYCPHCSFTCTRQHVLKRHVKRDHRTPVLGCPFCDKALCTIKDVRRHLHKEHPTEDQKAMPRELSTRITDDPEKILHRRRGKRRPKIYGCPLCVKSYTTLSALSGHVKKVHHRDLEQSVMRAHDDDCDENGPFQIKPEPGEHTRTDLTVEPGAVESEAALQHRLLPVKLEADASPSCDICEAVFPTIRALKQHRKSEHAEAEEYPATETMEVDNRLVTFTRKQSARSYKPRKKRGRKPKPDDFPQLDEHTGELVGGRDSDDDNGAIINKQLLGRHPDYEKIHENATRIVENIIQDLKEKVGASALLTFPCKDCTFVADRREQLRQHYLRKHLPKTYMCKHPNCDRVYGIYRDWKRHHFNHTMDGQMTCKIEGCGRSFTDYKAFERHGMTHQPGYVKQYWHCDACGRAFTSKAAMKMHHEREHQGVEKKWLCGECGTRFSQKNALKEHMNIHTGERPYMCMECGKTFTHESSLRSHKKSHSDRTYFTCEYCGKNFKFRNSYKAHIALHTGERKYGCSVCNKTFTQPHQLIRHSRIHTGDKPYLCKLCNSRFNDSSILRRHMHGVHGMREWKSADGHFEYLGERKRDQRFREITGQAPPQLPQQQQPPPPPPQQPPTPLPEQQLQAQPVTLPHMTLPPNMEPPHPMSMTSPLPSMVMAPHLPKKEMEHPGVVDRRLLASPVQHHPGELPLGVLPSQLQAVGVNPLDYTMPIHSGVGLLSGPQAH